MFVVGLLVFSVGLLSIQEVAQGIFTISPASVVQAKGFDASFYCLHPTASAIGWRLNGTSVNVRHPPNVTVGTTDGGSLHYLTILATPEYNGTVVQCFAFVINNGQQSVDESLPVTLSVQGLLGSVWNITRIPHTDAIIIAWEPPFSLNLTTAEPDIVYCVDIYNKTNDNQTSDYLISDCGVEEPQYTFTVSQLDPTDLFEITVIPRSNIVGASNGTPSDRLEVYFYVRPSTCANSVGVEISHDLDIVTHVPHWAAEVIITISIWNSDDTVHKISCDCVIITKSPTTSNNCSVCSSFILRNREYMVRVKCQNDIGIGESDKDLLLSTHGIVNGSFSLENQGELHLTCHFLADSTDRGCLAVSEGVETGALNIQSLLLQYKVAYRKPNSELTASSILQGLPSGLNKVYLYEIEETGLPGRYPAVNTSVVISGDSQTTIFNLLNETFNNFTLFFVAQQICISYSLKTNYLGCTIIHHPCISERLWDPISVYYVNAPSQTTCFSVSSNCSFSIAIFGVGQNGIIDSSPAKSYLLPNGTSTEISNGSDPSPNNKDKCLLSVYLPVILGSSLTLCTLLVASIMIVCLIKLCCSRKWRSNSQLSVARSEVIQSDYDVAIDLKKCEAYETVTSARARHTRSEQ